MFRKLVAGLSYSPSLVGELSAYDRRLKREVFLRKLGLIAAVLAVGVQAFVLLYPPESANPTSENDLVYGGITAPSELLAAYDTNAQNLRDIYSSIGISRHDLASLHSQTIRSDTSLYVVSRTPLFGSQDGVSTYPYSKAAGGQGIVYFTPLSLYDNDSFSRQHGSTYPALTAVSDTFGEFAVLTGSGNLVVHKLPNGTQANESQITYSKTAINATQSQPANRTTAQPSDRIVYQLTAQNTGDTAIDVAIEDRLGDVLEYATLTDNGGGALDTATNVLVWPAAQLVPGQKISKQFTVRVAAAIPATGRGDSNPASYDCLITNSLDNTLNVPVACPAAKQVEVIARQLPPVAASTSLATGVTVVTIALFFYARARQQREELRLIRHDLNTGALS
ncbi:hypothetical protein GII36_01170 [Candidatus Mycosynbacter amalyticus]|uniref:DUF11 domain-containing protein n=1 Tax=Candidatus Mycosynbacter amalyticus TaxID=2665156 RepID=A0A857MLH8_9BACT|nr:hypothetical protein [Candidatus Mycosynbacter amalyticus]QHN42462.1 hypothetical protein GII36_01170 [Candidatus Mycosynbacter amalyticus]